MRAFALVAVILAAVLAVLNARQDFVLDFELESASSEGQVVVYYDDGHGFREDATVREGLRKGLHTYRFRIPAARITGLRIDPSMNDRTSLIRDVALRDGGVVVKRFAASALVAANDIERSEAADGGRGVRFRVRPGAGDPYFLVRDAAAQATGLDANRFAACMLVALLATAALALLRALGRAAIPPRAAPVAAGLAVAMGLALALAVLASTVRQVSPDEVSHVAAARFYMERWWPPHVGDPASLFTYTAYGASYLNELDIVYLVAAKFALVLGFSGLDDVVCLRLFDIALLAYCAALAMTSRIGRVVVLPLLCSAQAWYVFGYFNADAIALVAAMLLATVVLHWLEREGEDAASHRPLEWRWALAIGGLLALCLLTKRTFYPFLPFIGAYAAWRVGYRTRAMYVLGALGFFLLGVWFYAGPPFENAPAMIASHGARWALAGFVAACFAAVAWIVYTDAPARRRISATLLVAAGVAVAIFAARVAVELGVNGLPGDKARALAALGERIAAPNFRPSVLGTSGSYYGLALSGRGTPLGEMLFGEHQWVSMMSASFFGLYGYMNVFAPDGLYRGQYVLAIVLLLAAAVAGARRSAGLAALLLALVGTVLTLELTILHSWVIDLQRQGRYAFAILPIVGVLLYEMKRSAAADPVAALACRIAQGAIALLWALALYSFAFVALPILTRI